MPTRPKNKAKRPERSESASAVERSASGGAAVRVRAMRASGKAARVVIESGRVSARANAEAEKGDDASKRPTWTFLSNHTHVLLLIAKDPEIRLRDVADQVGITERAVQRIVSDLEGGRYIERERSGRRNHYRVHPELPLRHPIEAHRRVASLIALIADA